jgi:hypothetical protein
MHESRSHLGNGTRALHTCGVDTFDKAISPVIAKNTPLSRLSGEEASGMPIDSIPLCSVAQRVTSSSQWTALQARIAQQEKEREAKQAEERR